MGSVAMETKNEGRGLAEWAYMCLGEAQTVARLILNRSRLDGTFYAMSSGLATESELTVMYEPVFCTYLDLDDLIETCGLSVGERRVIDALMEGHTITDIAEKNSCTKQTIEVQFRRGIRKITAQNTRNWLRVYGGEQAK